MTSGRRSNWNKKPFIRIQVVKKVGFFWTNRTHSKRLSIQGNVGIPSTGNHPKVELKSPNSTNTGSNVGYDQTSRATVSSVPVLLDTAARKKVELIVETGVDVSLFKKTSLKKELKINHAKTCILQTPFGQILRQMRDHTTASTQQIDSYEMTFCLNIAM